MALQRIEVTVTDANTGRVLVVANASRQADELGCLGRAEFPVPVLNGDDRAWVAWELANLADTVTLGDG